MNIVILEDNVDRQAAMKSCLNDRFHQFGHIFFESAIEMLEYLETDLTDTLIISLDHDLEYKSTKNGHPIDPGTGRQIADFLAQRPPSCPVLIATTNSNAAEGMELVLKDANWEVHRVHPWGGVEWISTQWFPSLRNAIVGTARPQPASAARNR